MKDATYAIVGGGLAAASAAEAMRAAGFDGRIVIYGEESEPPYERPPLSKEFLLGEIGAESVALRSPEFYALHEITVCTGRSVARVDVQQDTLEMQGGESQRYDKVLIATGASPRRLSVPGSDLPGVCYLRTVHEALALRGALKSRPRVLAVGAGFIGCEIAASARSLGCEVVLLGRGLPMAHALGSEIGAAYAEYHAQHGVTLRSGVTVERFRGAGRLEEALLSNGTPVACDLAVIGMGVNANVSLLQSELRTSDGIQTDEFCRTRSANVFAAGDVARSWRPRFGRHVRLEHFDNAQLQGAAAGKAMCGQLEPFDPIPFFWSYQYDLDLQYYGTASEWQHVIVRGKPDEASFIAFYLRDERVEAACAVNRSRDASAIKRLIGRRGLPHDRLAEDNVSLREFDVTGAGARS